MPGKRGVSKLVLLLAAAAVVHWLCRLTDEGRMLHGDVRQLGARKDRFEVGAVAGDMLYLTSFQSPLYGALLAVNLLEDEEPKVCSAEPATMCLACPVLKGCSGPSLPGHSVCHCTFCISGSRVYSECHPICLRSLSCVLNTADRASATGVASALFPATCVCACEVALPYAKAIPGRQC